MNIGGLLTFEWRPCAPGGDFGGPLVLQQNTLEMISACLQPSSLIWGRNKDLESHGHRIFNAYTAESTVNFLGRNWVWTRIENVDRDRTLLVGETPAALTIGEEPIGRVQAYTFGYERDLPVGIPSLSVGLGAQATTYGLPSQLKSVYGDWPAGFNIFLRMRPTGNVAQHMQMMHQH